MRQRPDAHELERLAASMLGDKPLPDNPKERSYEQRLAAKALAVARYDHTRGAADRTEELHFFAKLLGAAQVEAAGADDESRVVALNRRLAAEIRSGDWDNAPPAFTSLLMGQVRIRLARTNPRYLNARLPED